MMITENIDVKERKMDVLRKKLKRLRMSAISAHPGIQPVTPAT
jgi:hypothetical protein